MAPAVSEQIMKKMLNPYAAVRFSDFGRFHDDLPPCFAPSFDSPASFSSGPARALDSPASFSSFSSGPASFDSRVSFSSFSSGPPSFDSRVSSFSFSSGAVSWGPMSSVAWPPGFSQRPTQQRSTYTSSSSPAFVSDFTSMVGLPAPTTFCSAPQVPYVISAPRVAVPSHVPLHYNQFTYAFSHARIKPTGKRARQTAPEKNQQARCVYRLSRARERETKKEVERVNIMRSSWEGPPIIDLPATCATQRLVIAAVQTIHWAEESQGKNMQIRGVSSSHL